MKKKILKACIVCLSSIVFLLGIKKLVQACGGSWDWFDENTIQFDPAIMGPTKFSPLFYDGGSPTYHDIPEMEAFHDTTNEIKVLTNAAGWKKYMNNKVSENEIYTLVYSLSKDSLIKVSQLFKKKKAIYGIIASNAALIYLYSHKDKDAIDYIIFARQCEPFVKNYDYDWYNPVSRTTSGMDSMITAGLGAYKKCKNNDLKLRYAFQITRLAHYSYQFDRCISFYEDMMQNSTDSTNIIYVWGKSLYAGALSRAGRSNEAFYNFSILFDKYYSVNTGLWLTNLGWITNNESVFKLCKNNHEWAVILALNSFFGQEPDDIKTMKYIYQLDPQSDLLDVLLTRSINKIEEELNPNLADGNNQAGKFDKANATLEFIRGIINADYEKRPYFWFYAAGYLTYLTGENQYTDLYYTKAKSLAPKNSFVLAPIYTLELLRKLDTVKVIDRNFETSIIPHIDYLLKNQRWVVDHARKNIFKKLADKYFNQNDSVKGILCLKESYSGLNLESDPNSRTLQAIINLKPVNGFDSLLLTNFISDRGFNFYGGYNVYKALGRIYMREFNFKEAAKAVGIGGQVDGTYTDAFNNGIHDCYDCMSEIDSGKYYSLEKFAKRMDELQNLMSRPSKKQADYYYEYALGLYNMTCFGGANWYASRSFLSSNYGPYFETDACNEAKKYFVKSIPLFKDKELKAKACFMAAKCERNNFYMPVNNNEETFYYNNKLPPAGEYFKLLADKYSDTKFYEEAIQECGYFSEYVKSVKK